jgi:hypothetical protein
VDTVFRKQIPQNAFRRRVAVAGVAAELHQPPGGVVCATPRRTVPIRGEGRAPCGRSFPSPV